VEIIPSAQVAQAPVYSYLFLYMLYMQKVWERTSPALMLLAAVAACIRFEPPPLSPEQTASDFESRPLDNPKLKEYLEINLHRKFFNGPASSWDFSMLTLAAQYDHPESAVARAKHISTNTELAENL
jgi:hypothetical protein